MDTRELIYEDHRFGFGFVLADGRVIADNSPEASDVIYGPLSGAPTIVCARCNEPSWHVTLHAVERHGDTDVEVLPPQPGRKPPEWFQPDWI